MEKLYKLKKWLTIDEATHRLSIETGEEVTNADVLQLAADEQLRISVNFPHNWTGKTCDLTNAGPTKINSAIDVGATLLDENEFKTMIETGEMPQ
ncbi:TPA: hypothetical protein ACPG1Q_000275 [Haemophilus influenzae 10810]|uniref:hypothetical protein n=1 Tax=Haemophilus influenzae TaxID=727 RepID=UPI001EF8317B|nr:hypothetical protein [Haemophilus influenzae]